MKRLTDLGEVRGELARLRGTANISDWLAIAKILRGRNLFLAIGKTRIAGLEGTKALRDKLDEVGLYSSKMRQAIAAIVGLWLEEQITGEIDLVPIIRALEGEASVEVLIRKQLEKPAVVETHEPPPPPPAASLRERVDALAARGNDPAAWCAIVRLQLELAAIHERNDSPYGAAIAYSYAAQYQLLVAEQASDLDAFRRAIEYEDKAIIGFRMTNNEERLMYSLSYAGEAMLKIARKTSLQADLERAMVYLEEALHLLNRAGNKKREGYNLSYLGEAHVRLAELLTDEKEKIKDFRKGLFYYEKAVPLLSSLAPVNPNAARVLAFAYQKMGFAHLQIAEITHEITEWQAALEILKKAAHELERAGFKKAAVYALSHAGRAASVVAKQTNDPVMWEEAVTCYLASSAAFTVGDLNSTHAAHDAYFAAKAQWRLAALSGSDEELEKEADYFLRAVALYRALDRVKYAKRIAECLSRVIIIRWNCYFPTRSVELVTEIIDYADEMARAAQVCGIKGQEVWAHKQGANAWYELATRNNDAEAYRQSVERRLEALKVYLELKQFERAASCCSHLGDAYYEIALLTHNRGDMEMALIYILRAASLFDELKINRFGAEEYFALDICSRLENL